MPRKSIKPDEQKTKQELERISLHLLINREIKSHLDEMVAAQNSGRTNGGFRVVFIEKLIEEKYEVFLTTPR